MLARAFAFCLCDKYPFHIGWLRCVTLQIFEGKKKLDEAYAYYILLYINDNTSYYRVAFWRLVVFIEQNGSYIDAQIESPLDTNKLTKSVTFKAANNKSYKVVDLTGVQTVQYDSLFSFYTTTPIRYEDIAGAQENILSTWTTTGE